MAHRVLDVGIDDCGFIILYQEHRVHNALKRQAREDEGCLPTVLAGLVEKRRCQFVQAHQMANEHSLVTSPSVRRRREDARRNANIGASLNTQVDSKAGVVLLIFEPAKDSLVYFDAPDGWWS